MPVTFAIFKGENVLEGLDEYENITWYWTLRDSYCIFITQHSHLVTVCMTGNLELNIGLFVHEATKN